MLDVEDYEGELKDLRRFIRESDHESRLMEIELRKTKHALWMARALRAGEKADRIWEANNLHSLSYLDGSLTYPIFVKWQWAERKCLAKAKEFE